MRQVIGIVAAVAMVFGSAFSPVAVQAADTKEKDGQQLTMDQVPAPVKATLEREAKGGTVGQVTKETEKGKTFYEAQIMKNGKERYVHVAMDGKVLKRESAKKEQKEEQREGGKK